MSDSKDDVKMAVADDVPSAKENESAKDNNSMVQGDDDLGDDIPMTFPQKLMEILNRTENNDIIAWLAHGKGFVIYKKKKFAADLLPKFFKQAKFTSFTRKLNRWGFTRVTRGPETGAYYHKFFVRDEPRLCMQMSCQNIRHYQEQMALEQQQRQQHEAALAAAGQFSPALMATAARMGALGLGGGLPGLTDVNLLQQQTAIQQLQLEQLQKQQQLQANELVRRAMATQATASATQAHLAAMTSALQGNNSTGGAQQQQQQQPPSSSMDANGAPGDLYTQLLHSKASQMTARPLMMAIQNSLRSAPANVLASAPAMAAPSNSGKPEDASESSNKRAVRRASAA
mmetsp:Transcript_6983/g.10175  ORF Transcript_6983/g.10175 Transcript_6983/m.10175 type:complete len:343 (-) Transcript_6983:357-1385(-)|eukprot:CAMPEP_0194033170 /NCGR_PEP_ID=MMETSP0009_2-20130614/5949_1 /TAXON_ID=210454 /ORGANISM="Grammatophora oceanica, Strain CCMP 410" /LENGTH=342 /DNA_ID=CAMNT_0038673811 /DNA_START=153 /DNA_END=1181 /DNA_ORIENTATION=+